MTREEKFFELIRNSHALLRAIVSNYEFNEEELNIIKHKFGNNETVLKYIDYYIYGNYDVFSLQKKEHKKGKRLILFK